MTLIDLTQPLTHNMPVFPGDPPVTIEEIHTLDKEGWRLRLLSFSSHIGTHVNVPFHMIEAGKNLDEVSLDDFWGPAQLYTPGMDFKSESGIIFHTHNIDQKIADRLIQTPPKFIGLSAQFEFDISLEKLLLEHGIISFENLVNTEALPSTFTFYGFPLKIGGGDGSPVRAVAMA